MSFLARYREPRYRAEVWRLVRAASGQSAQDQMGERASICPAGHSEPTSAGRGCVPKPLLSRAPLEREGRPGRPLDANVVVCRGVEGVLLLNGVLVALEQRVPGVLVFGNPALYIRACMRSVYTPSRQG